MRTPEQEDSYELHLARDVANQHHGAFVNYLALALEQADAENFELLRPVWQAIVRKYNLRCDEKCQRDGTGWDGEIPAWAVERM